MNRLLILSTSFHAVHMHGPFPVGHRWVLRASVEVGANTTTEAIWAQLSLIRAELHERQIEKMLPGVDPSALGLAAWAFERLSGPLPKLESVSVSEDDERGETGTVTRTIR